MTELQTSFYNSVMCTLLHSSTPPPPLHMSIYLSLFHVSSIKLVCVFIYLFCFEGCKHIWYWFEAVRYDSNWLNRPIVQHITCHNRGVPSPPTRQMYYCPANVMTRLAFASLPLSFFSPPSVSSLSSIHYYWAVLLRLKYWSLLRLTLTWQSGLPHIFSSKPSKFPHRANPQNNLSFHFFFSTSTLLLFYGFEIVSLRANLS